MIPVTSSLSLLLNYNDIEHMHKNKHNGNNFLVYGFYLINEFAGDITEIQKPNWYQVQRSGNTYSPMRVHLPKQRGGYLSTGTLIYDSNLKLFKDKTDAEMFLELYTHEQKKYVEKLHDFFTRGLDYLSEFKLP